jgi:hypothetical protein
MPETAVDLTRLRAPFPPEYVGKLPRVTCRACSDGRCGDHKKAKCAECGNWISERHIHLDYVGHADVTIRLLEVDPEWSWAPKATDADPELLKAAMASGDSEIVRAVIENAPPKFETDRNGSPVGLWIKLTVGGVTRLGVGSCPSGQNDAEKVLIGDALRNAAMRFGVAVELWAKGDRADPTAENATASAGKADRARPAADPFESATPARPRNQGPRSAEEQAIDHDAQRFADEADKATVPADIEDIHKRAREAGKVASFIRNPSSGGVGKLAVYLDWKRKQLMAAKPPVAAVLDADDPWTAAIEGMGSAEDGEALLVDVADQRGRGEIEAERAAVIEQAIEAAIAARFPAADRSAA